MERNLAPVIVFSFSRKDCEAYGLQVAKLDLNTGEEWAVQCNLVQPKYFFYQKINPNIYLPTKTYSLYCLFGKVQRPLPKFCQEQLK